MQPPGRRINAKLNVQLPHWQNRQHPAEYVAYQQGLAAAPTNSQQATRAIDQIATKRMTYESAVADEIRKSFSPLIAEQRIVNQYGNSLPAREIQQVVARCRAGGLSRRPMSSRQITGSTVVRHYAPRVCRIRDCSNWFNGRVEIRWSPLVSSRTPLTANTSQSAPPRRSSILSLS
jgi:hypothetical protein